MQQHRIGNPLRFLFALSVMVIGLAIAAAPSLAQTVVPAPEGPVILTVEGDLKHTNTSSGIDFDFDMLAKMPRSRIVTTTPWTAGEVVFEGVSLKDLLGYLGVTSGTLRAYAINQYAVEIPVADATTSMPIVAYLRDGERMSVRQKGPLWVMYPFDDLPQLRNEAFHARAIWQLRSIVVEG